MHLHGDRRPRFKFLVWIGQIKDSSLVLPHPKSVPLPLDVLFSIFTRNVVLVDIDGYTFTKVFWLSQISVFWWEIVNQNCWPALFSLTCLATYGKGGNVMSCYLLYNGRWKVGWVEWYSVSLTHGPLRVALLTSLCCLHFPSNVSVLYFSISWEFSSLFFQYPISGSVQYQKLIRCFSCLHWHKSKEIHWMQWRSGVNKGYISVPSIYWLSCIY